MTPFAWYWWRLGWLRDNGTRMTGPAWLHLGRLYVYYGRMR